jgi:nitrite reductase/ring-hydroxylating ferredoxin subunit
MTGEWIPVGPLADLPDAKAARVVVGDVELLVYRSGDAVSAVSNHCTHQGAPLNRGTVRTSGSLVSVTCPLHGSTFSLGDGRVLRGPARIPIDVWETRVVDGVMQVRAPS